MQKTLTNIQQLSDSSASSHPSQGLMLFPKIQAPKPGKFIFHRKHLHSQISSLLQQGHLWITGPPGAGKTVLAADYVAQSPLPVAWYELDLLDTDLGSFFTSFPLAFSSLYADPPSAIQSLPQFQPEDMLGLPVFARKYFRSLFRLLSRDILLILDNVQEIPDDSPLLEIFTLCLQELPVDCKAILLSRTNPPPPFARLRINGRLRVFNSKMLSFTQEEIGSVLTLHGIIKEQENCIDYLWQTTAGWAAGLTLLLKEQNRQICSMNSGGELDHQELFTYFAGVIFSRLEKDKKTILMAAAFLPEIQPEIVDRLTGIVSSEKYFHKLCRNNFFTYALTGEEKLFQLHPLFKEFLQTKATELLPKAHLNNLLEKAAEIYLAAGNVEYAVDLLNLAKKWHKSVALIVKTGAGMIVEGRFKTLLRWKQALPKDVVNGNPWLLFYFGNATIAFAPHQAIEILKHCFNLFKKQENSQGALIACSALTNSIINHLSELALLDPWLEYLDKQLDPKTFPDENSFENNTIANAIFRALVLRRPDHPDVDVWRRYVVRHGGMHPALITHYLWTGRFMEARAALDHIYANQTKIGSRLQLSAIKAMEIQYYLIMSEPDKCIQAVNETVKMMTETGIRIWEVHCLILAAGCCLNCGEATKASHFLMATENKIHHARLLERSFYHVVKTLEAMLADNLTAADRHQQSALKMAHIIGMPSYDLWCWYGSALVAILQENYTMASFRLNNVLDQAISSKNPWFICQAYLGLAFMHLQKDERRQAVTFLHNGCLLARRNNYLTFFFFLPKMMCALAVLALEENIETTFISRLIKRWNLTPEQPPLHLDNWPWPLKFYTLGRFSIIRHGKKLKPSNLSQNKPLLLLQALIALGGRQVSKARLANILWPDSDGDEQAGSLKITLHRLRRLLGTPHAIVQTASYLSLNSHICWVDSWQFERLGNQALLRNPKNINTITNTTDKALTYYTGSFLTSLERESWTFDYRQRLQKIHKRLLTRSLKTIQEEVRANPAE